MSAAIYFVWATLVWTILVWRETSVSAPLAIWSGAICVVGATVALLAARRAEKRDATGLFGYALALLGRTGLPAICAVVEILLGDPSSKRPLSLLLLVAYFATAPVHVWASLPTRERRV